MHCSRQTLRSEACAVIAVAATYAYFLLFAEFAFLELLGRGGAGGGALRVSMAFLGAGGLVGSLLSAAVFTPARFKRQLVLCFAFCGFAAWLAVQGLVPLRASVLAALVGCSAGSLTVCLASGLGQVLRRGREGLQIGLGTGLAYAVCNVPGVFAAGADRQAWLSVGFALAGLLASTGLVPRAGERSQDPEYSARASVSWILSFALLIWLDSSAFYVIQHQPVLLAQTWAGETVLWANAATHLAAALAAGLLIDRGWRRRMPLLAYAGLALACTALACAVRTSYAKGFYTAGVSVYSTLLVWHAARSGRPWFVGLLFALAGWVGSALGIGMAQDLTGVPLWFVLVAGLVLLCVRVGRVGATRVLSLVFVLFLFSAGTPVFGVEDEAVLRGREVYISEGCMHCHSQYVRPGVKEDLERWGPASRLEVLKQGQPPLPGNRRQGPDLANVGNRRSPEWNRLHLMRPQSLMPRSRMPAYVALFAAGETRGEDLLAYLASLGADTLRERQAFVLRWQPPTGVEPDKLSVAKRLYRELCEACHGAEGRGDGPLAARLIAKPADLQRRPLLFVACEADGSPRWDALPRVIKFGLPNSAMAGHEYLADAEVLALADYVKALADRKP